jgi:hypothetical protein
MQRSTEASSLLPTNDTALTVSERLSGGTGSMMQSCLAMHMVYPVPD